MKKHYFFFLFFFLSLHSSAQQFSLDHTLCVGGVGGNGIDGLVDILYDDRDKSFVFTGLDYYNCGTGDIPPCPPVSGQRDLLVGKVDSNGNIAWIRLYASTYDDGGNTITKTNTGYVVLGEAGKGNGDASNVLHDADAWLLNLDFQGNLRWSKGYGSASGEEPAPGLKQTSDGGYVIAGYSNGSGGDIPFQYVSSPFAYDGFVIKTDSLGNVQWSKTMGGTEDDQFINVFEINKEYYITGWGGSHDHECNDQSWHPSNVNTSWDFFLIKLDSTGNYLWNRTYGGSRGENMGDAIFDDRDSTIVMIGYTSSRDYMLTSPGPTNMGPDACVIKVKLDGSLQWAKVYGDTLLSDGYQAHIRTVPQDKGYAISYQVMAFTGTPQLPPYHIMDHMIFGFPL